MINMTLGHAAEVLKLDLQKLKQNENTVDFGTRFSGFCIDSRKINPGNLFIALPGENVDGHHFLDDAHQMGAAAALVAKKMPSDLPQLLVKDTGLALGQLASSWRNQFSLPLIAVTGSNGKTTLKNMITAILIAACGQDTDHVLTTQGNLNNHLGLPLTLAKLNEHHRFGVLEMGMNHFGEIEYLSKLARPTIAVITNAASAHLEGVGDLAGVARAKAEIFLGLPAEKGLAILNRDDAFFPFWRDQLEHQSYQTFGFHPEADVTLAAIAANAGATSSSNMQTVNLKTPQGDLVFNLPLLGKHNVLNAMAATAATMAVGISLSAIKTGLTQVQPEHGRLNVHALPNGANIIDDSYNANPFSLKAAIDALVNFSGKKILVLGDMKELGKEAKQLHRDAGAQIRAAHIDYLFTYGELSAQTAHVFGEGAFHFTEQDKLLNALKPFLSSQTTILIKGSRSMRMENIVTGLINEH